MWPIDLFNQRALDKISPAAEWNRAPRSNYISFFFFLAYSLYHSHSLALNEPHLTCYKLNDFTGRIGWACVRTYLQLLIFTNSHSADFMATTPNVLR